MQCSVCLAPSASKVLQSLLYETPAINAPSYVAAVIFCAPGGRWGGVDAGPRGNHQPDGGPGAMNSNGEPLPPPVEGYLDSLNRRNYPRLAAIWRVSDFGTHDIVAGKKLVLCLFIQCCPVARSMARVSEPSYGSKDVICSVAAALTQRAIPSIVIAIISWKTLPSGFLPARESKA